MLYFAYLLFGAGLTRIERLRVLALVVLFMASVLFWAGYEQAGSSLNLFAERYTDRHLGGSTMPASWFQSLNPSIHRGLRSAVLRPVGMAGAPPSRSVHAVEVHLRPAGHGRWVSW